MAAYDIISFSLSLITAGTTFTVMHYIGYAVIRYFNS